MPFLENIGKKSKKIEITAQLFDTCPNCCSFCLQNNKQKFPYDKKNLVKVIDSIKSLIETDNANEYELILQGGELFSDNVKNSQLTDYEQLLSSINAFIIQHNKIIEFQINTNLINIDPYRILKLLENLKTKNITAKIATSFDFIGRFKDDISLAKFCRNLNILNQYINIITMVLTKENINALILQSKFKIDTVKIFNDLYNANYDFAFEVYFPDINTYSSSLPDDNDMLNFFYYIIDNYKNLTLVKCLKQDKNYSWCACNHLVLNDGKCTACIHWIFDDKLFNDPLASYDKHVKNYLNRYHCMSCQYFKRCFLGCFYANDFKLAKHHETCINRKIFEYLDFGKKEFFKDCDE